MRKTGIFFYFITVFIMFFLLSMSTIILMSYIDEFGFNLIEIAKKIIYLEFIDEQFKRLSLFLTFGSSLGALGITYIHYLNIRSTFNYDQETIDK